MTDFESKEYFFEKILEEIEEYKNANTLDKPKEYGDIVLAVFRYGEKMGYRANYHLELSWLKLNSRMFLAKDLMKKNNKLTLKEAYMLAKDLEGK